MPLTPAPGLPSHAAKAVKPSYRKTLMPCVICGQEIMRKDMASHRLVVHGNGDVQLATRTSVKSMNLETCMKCGKHRVETWMFKKPSRGYVHLCDRCKKTCLKEVFGSEGQPEKRIRTLKESLNEIRTMIANPAYASTHGRLKEQAKELEELIKKPSVGTRNWSPVLPGSYGSGKRR